MSYGRSLSEGRAPIAGLEPGTYAVEAWSAAGELIAEELTTVAASPGDRPVLGFVTSFRPEAVGPVLSWLRALRCTAVQFYDWMASYAEPLADTGEYTDRLGRRHSLTAIGQLTAGCREFGATPQAYAPVYGVDPPFAKAHPGMLLYRGDGDPQRLADLVEITDPGNPGWQRYWLDRYGAAADALGFTGFHLDTYGYPRQPLDQAGQPVPMQAAYDSFLRAVRAARPDTVVSFNQVNGVPRGFELPGPPGFRYIEVWPPNDRWRHLEGLLERSADASQHSAALAIYPPVWDGDRDAALRTVVRTEAVATSLGASLLVWGDDLGCLRHPYYPDHERLTEAEAGQALAWHRFALRCRDLFTGGLDTSWTDIGDENGGVYVRCDAEVSPEPAEGAVHARVVRHDGCIAVSVLDLTGSPTGSWQSGTAQGRCQRATVTVLLDRPGEWTADVAVLGTGDGRFSPVSVAQRGHREGLAIEAELPLASGWSVLRLTRNA